MIGNCSLPFLISGGQQLLHEDMIGCCNYCSKQLTSQNIMLQLTFACPNYNSLILTWWTKTGHCYFYCIGLNVFRLLPDFNTLLASPSITQAGLCQNHTFIDCMRGAYEEIETFKANQHVH